MKVQWQVNIAKNRASFTENFNRPSRQRRPVSKGFYLPTLAEPNPDLAGIYESFLQRYRYFGDKIAFGPRVAVYEPISALRIFHHLNEEFPFARLVLTTRRPRANVVAMAAINSGLSWEYLIDNWLSGMPRIIDFLLVTERSVLCPFERITEGKVEPLTALTGIAFPNSAEFIKREEITTGARDVNAWFEDKPASLVDICDAAEGYYARMLLHIDDATGRPVTEADISALQSCRADFVELYKSFLASVGWS